MQETHKNSMQQRKRLQYKNNNIPGRQFQSHKNQKATMIIHKQVFNNLRAKIIPLEHLIEKKCSSHAQKTGVLKQKKQHHNVCILQRKPNVKRVQFSLHKQNVPSEKKLTDRVMPFQTEKKINTQVSIQSRKKLPRSLSYCKKELNSFGKTLKTVKGFFQNLIISQNGCRCKQPCKQADAMFKWANKTQIQARTKLNQLKQKWRSLKMGINDKENKNSNIIVLKYLSQIRKDVRRTYSYHPTFQNSEFIEIGQRTLLYYLLEDQQVGYVQGMNMVMAGLLFHLKDQHRTYCAFRAVMRKLRPMYIENFKECHKLTNQISNLICQYLPDLNQHFQEIGFAGQVNLIVFPWLLSLMGVIVKLQNFHLIIQGFMSQGWEFIEKVILSFLAYRKEEMMEMDDCGDLLAFLSSSNSDTYDVNWKQIIKFSQTI